MSGIGDRHDPMRRRWRAARMRACIDALLVGLPPAFALVALGWRWGGARAALVVALAAALAVAGGAVWRMRRIDRRWLQRRLDALAPGMEDSAALLFADPAGLSPLQHLQRARLQQRVVDAPDLRPSWSRRALAASAALAALCAATALLWPVGGQAPTTARDAGQDAPSAQFPQLVAQRLHVAPPGYTGLPDRDLDALDAKAPQDSRLRWTLRFAPQPGAVAVVFHDGGRIELQRQGEDWVAEHRLQRSTLYRVVASSGQAQPQAQPPPPLHRLDAVPDRSPRVRVLAPEASLTMMAPNQRSWQVAFEASDDYGVDADARLHVTVARGSGEQIRFEESTRVLRGSGELARRRFQAGIDVAALALDWGEDLVVQLEVRDNRQPRPQTVRSSSLILRRPLQPVPDVSGLEGLARQVLPAYFRSQRQIIIDAEALLKQKPAMAPERFLDRSDALGVDQRLLRLRYGQFLGEESEGGAPPPPTHDAAEAPAAPLLPIDDYGQQPAEAAAGASDHRHADEAGHDDHDHDHGAPPTGDGHGHDHDHAGQASEDGVFGRDANVLAEFGHTHDLPEAATLLDPRTREILRGALREMWQSELELRQGQPQQALPYAHRALELIKQVQQADRIYLAKLGSQLPPIDESRRLGGARAGIARRALPAAPARPEDEVPARVWRRLGDPSPSAPDGEALDALDAWVRANGERLRDPLALVAAIDALRNDPSCGSCREDLAGLLWRAMARPPATVPRRDAVDEGGARYLDALGEPSP